MKKAERRKFERVLVPDLHIQERNGDYFFHFRLINLSEEGFLAMGRSINNAQSYISYINLYVERGPKLLNVAARIVWERKDEDGIKIAYHMLGIEEKDKLSLRKYALKLQKEREESSKVVFLTG